MLWRSLERVIPDIRARAEVVQIGARGPCCALMTVLTPPPCLSRTSSLRYKPCSCCAGANLFWQGSWVSPKV